MSNPDATNTINSILQAIIALFGIHPKDTQAVDKQKQVVQSQIGNLNTFHGDEAAAHPDVTAALSQIADQAAAAQPQPPPSTGTLDIPKSDQTAKVQEAAAQPPVENVPPSPQP